MRPHAVEQACEKADLALRKKLGPPVAQARPCDMDDSLFREALARLQAVCVELNGARRPIDWSC